RAIDSFYLPNSVVLHAPEYYIPCERTSKNQQTNSCNAESKSRTVVVPCNIYPLNPQILHTRLQRNDDPLNYVLVGRYRFQVHLEIVMMLSLIIKLRWLSLTH